MARTKRNRHQLGRDRLEISRLYLRGWTQEEIAARLGISQPQVSYDLRIVRQHWQANATNELGERVAEDIARLGMVEREYWEGWERSKKDGKEGNARFLNGALACIAHRIRLFDFARFDIRALVQALPPTAIALTDHSKLSDAELAAAVKQMLARDESTPPK